MTLQNVAPVALYQKASSPFARGCRSENGFLFEYKTLAKVPKRLTARVGGL